MLKVKKAGMMELAGSRPRQVARRAGGKIRFTPLQVVVHIGAWIPLLWLAWAYRTDNLTINPIQAATQHTGRYAITLLVLSLAVTPLYTLTGFRQLPSVRRPLGLYAAMYAGLHFLMFAGVDYGFDWELLQGAIFEKRFVLVGLGALVILLALAFTSFQYWMKRLGKRWKRLHRLVYLAGGLAVLHYAWAVKGDLLRLQGDIWKPLAYGLVVAVLLILRLPPVRQRASRLRRRVSTAQGPGR